MNVDGADAVRMSRGKLYHAVGPVTVTVKAIISGLIHSEIRWSIFTKPLLKTVVEKVNIRSTFFMNYINIQGQLLVCIIVILPFCGVIACLLLFFTRKPVGMHFAK